MRNNFNYQKNYKLVLSWIILLSLVSFIVFKTTTSTINAQQTTGQLSVSCSPNKETVRKNENVIFIAKVENATDKIKYSWDGTKIKSVNAPRVTTSYASLGKKKAIVTIVSGEKRLRAECFTTVIESPNQQGGQQGGNNPLDQLKDLLGGGQQGGNNPLQGGQQGGQAIPTTEGSSIPTQQTQTQREEAARQKAVQQYNRKQQQAEKTFEQDKQKCDQEQGSEQSNVDSIKESFEQNQPTEMGQLVPVDPKPIVNPISNIRENIERLTAKDIGLSDSQEPPLDQKMACKAHAAVKKKAEQSENFLKQGRKGNPQWVTDYNALERDAHDIGSREYINSLANDQSCRAEENKKIAQSLAKVPRSVIGAESQQQSCSVEKKKDLNDLGTYLAYSSAENNPSYNLAEKWSGLLANRTQTTESVLYQTSLNDGFIPIKDSDGLITNPPKIYTDIALFDLNGKSRAIGNVDEITEGQSDLLEDLMGKLDDSVTGIEQRTPAPGDMAS
jgi:hypothetical protein